MQAYRDFAPTGFDHKGAFLDDDHQDWLVVGVSITRDSGRFVRMKAITTKYHGPTDKRGARISATDGDGNRASVAYPPGVAYRHN